MNYLEDADRGLNIVQFSSCSFARNRSPNYQQQSLNKINVKSLALGKLLGSGGFGSVYQGVYKGRKVAVKKLHVNRKNPHAVAESFIAEVSVVSLRHKNIVRVLAVSSVEASCRDIYIIMEYAGNRNLQNIIVDENERITDQRRKRYAIDIASALNYIHQRRVVHLDLKPANILVTCQDTCKLGDFGCSKILPENGLCSPATPTNSFLTGTLSYRAPELLKGDFPSSKADLYSMGICLWQLLTREKPYGAENLYVVIFGVVAYNMRPSITKKLRQKYKTYVNLCEALWKANPAERPDGSAVLRILRNDARKKPEHKPLMLWRS
eukprot:gene136-748_t